MVSKNKLYEFMDYLKIEREFSDNTINSYKIDINQFIEFTKKDIFDLKKDDIDKYLVFLKGNYKENTYLRKISSIKSFNKFLKITLNKNNKYIELLEVKKSRKRLPKYLTVDEMNTLLDSLSEDTNVNLRNKAIFETLYATGMRVSELINIKVSDINLENKTIRLTGKGEKTRLVIINKTAYEILKKYIYDGKIGRLSLQKEMIDYLFLNNKGKKITRHGINYILKGISAQCGLESVTPHMFRHSIATHMLSQGANLRMIQMLLGHANISTTEVYTHINKKYLQNEYKKHNIFNKEKGEK